MSQLSTKPAPAPKATLPDWAAIRALAPAATPVAATTEFTTQVVQGMAHKLNNLLTIFHGYSSLLLSEDGLPEIAIDGLHEIQRGALLTSKLVNRLQALVRPTKPRLEEIDLEKFLPTFRNQVAGDLTPGVEIELGETAGTVISDPGLLREGLTELVTNACIAFQSPGVIRIETGAPRNARGETRDLEGMLAIAVLDHGEGVEWDMFEKICEPFFSTHKDIGCLGLGLSIAGCLAHAMGGRLTIATKPGLGTCARITLVAAATDRPE